MHKRGYADVSFGQIHYRTAGDGAPLILLHQSPRSSLEYNDLITRLSERYRVIAPDNPGNGMSDPLPGEHPDMKDYADALIEFMDAVGLEQVALYGFHTGGSIAAATAAYHQDRVSVAVANGLAILTPEFRDELLERYLPEITPAENGSHVSWLWQRVMDQSKHFPWYRNGDEFKLDMQPYHAQKAHEIFVDFIMAGNDYIAPYQAAFEFNAVKDGLLPLDNLLVVAAKSDPLFLCFPALPEGQKKQSFENAEAALDAAIHYIDLNH